MRIRSRGWFDLAAIGLACAACAWFLTPAIPRAFTRTVVVIPYGADNYRYKIGAHGHADGFQAVDYDDFFYATGPAPFGRGPARGWCPVDTTVRTRWLVGTDLVVRKVFYLPMEATNLRVYAAIDNDLQVFINGVDISHGMRRHSGCARHDQFMARAPDDILKVGTNILAVRARDRGVDCYLDLKVTAEFEWI